MAKRNLIDQLDLDEVEKEAAETGRHWKDVLRHKLSLIDGGGHRRRQAEATRRFLEQLNNLPAEGEDTTDASENHDYYLYGWKK